MAEESASAEGAGAEREATPSEEGARNSAERNQKKKLWKRKGFWIVVAIIVAAATGISLPYYLYALHHASTDDAFIAGDIVPVAPRVAGHVTEVHASDNQRVRKGDLLVEIDSQDFESRVAKAKAALDVAVAMEAAASSSLDLVQVSADAELEEAKSAKTLADAAVQTAQRRVESSSSELDEAKAAVAENRAAADESKANEAAAKAQAHVDELTLQRYQGLLEGKSVTQQQVDEAAARAAISKAKREAAARKVASEEAQLTQAQAAVNSMQANLAEKRSQLAESRASLAEAEARLTAARTAPQKIALHRAQLDAARAQVEQARAEKALAELELSYTKIAAPGDGWVTKKAVEKGQYVAVGQALLAVVRPDVWVTANFKEIAIAEIWPGQPVSISVDAYSGRTFRGRVDSIQAGTGASFSLLPPENATGNYIKVVQRVPVKIVFEEPPDLSRYHLAIGMSVVPTVDISRRPRRAVKTARTGDGRSSEGKPEEARPRR